MPLCSEERDSCCYERCPGHPLWISSSHAVCGGRREADLLLSQMHLSRSGFGSCDSTAIAVKMSWLYYTEPCVLFHHSLETKITATHLGLPGMWDRSPTQQVVSPRLGTAAARPCSAFLVVIFLQASRHTNSTSIRFCGQFVMWV